jgi:hypothetical protein
VPRITASFEPPTQVRLADKSKAADKEYNNPLL